MRHLTAAQRETGHTVAALAAMSVGNIDEAAAALDAAVNAGLDQMALDAELSDPMLD